ncbi:MAG: peptidase S10 [Rhodothalassiaceae bacterium]
MMRNPVRLAMLALAILSLSGAAAGAAEDKASAAPYEAKSWSKELRGTFNGKRIDYVATASETVMKDADGKEKAAIFSISYVAKDRDATRPVTFLFNGGPGSASLWLHMGVFGPKRVAIPSDARDDGAPPYPILDNPLSILDVTDLVFIDPVGTGFSKALGGTDPKEFFGIGEDARSVGDFIRRWLNANGRWNSPKFIGGESYGTTRTAAVVNELEGRYNDVSFNGLLLISTILDFSAEAPEPGNEMSPVLYLPTMAATAWYHDRVPGKPAIEGFLEEARAFASGPYLAALMKGNRLGAEERAAVRTRLAYFTGLSETYLEQADLRVAPQRFMKELLRDRGLTVGRLDSRYTGVDYDAAGERPDNDPSFYAIDGAYTAAVNSWLRDELGVDFDRPYSVIGGLGGRWNWQLEDRFRGAYLNVAPYIGRALRENSGLRVFNAAGWFDFATPFYAAEYSLTRTGIPDGRITFRYYPAGHMMYVHEPSLEALARDVRSFIMTRQDAFSTGN